MRFAKRFAKSFWRMFLTAIDAIGWATVRIIGAHQLQKATRNIPKSIPEPVSTGLLHCLRCQAPLAEIAGHGEWKTYWLCNDCCVAWHFEGGQLVQGRNQKAKKSVKVSLVSAQMICEELRA